MLFFISCSPEYGETTKVMLKFDDFSRDSGSSNNLIKEITDSMSYTNLLRSINNSKTSTFSCPPHKNTSWRIEIYKVDEKNNGRLLYDLICTTENEIGLWDYMLTNCYKNDFLIQHIIELAKVEEIKNFKGKMTQEDYDRLFEAE